MRKTSTTQGTTRATLARLGACGVLALAAPACADPESRYDDFVERTDSMRHVDAAVIEPGDRFDWSGHYVLALSTSLAPDAPLLFGVDAEVASDLSTIDLQIQPLTTDTADSPRTPTGEPITLTDIPYAEDGRFDADLGEVSVPGEANPITGSDIVASVQLMATALASDAGSGSVFCGQVTGMVTVPLSFDLMGSTFGAVQSDDDPAANILLECP